MRVLITGAAGKPSTCAVAEHVCSPTVAQPSHAHAQTNALHPTGQIGYAIVAMAANGDMLGQDQPVILHLLDIEPAKQALEGVKMELMDAAYPLLVGELLGCCAAAHMRPSGQQHNYCCCYCYCTC
jgi:hypothetical protein